MKIAVHLHLYYLEQLPKILKYLKSLDGTAHDLHVTMVKHDKDAEKAISTFNPKANIIIVPNRGYDLGPFIEFLHQIDLDAYDLILKVHTKKEISQNHTWLNGRRLDNKLYN